MYMNSYKLGDQSKMFQQLYVVKLNEVPEGGNGREIVGRARPWRREKQLRRRTGRNEVRVRVTLQASLVYLPSSHVALVYLLLLELLLEEELPPGGLMHCSHSFASSKSNFQLYLCGLIERFMWYLRLRERERGNRIKQGTTKSMEVANPKLTQHVGWIGILVEK